MITQSKIWKNPKKCKKKKLKTRRNWFWNRFMSLKCDHLGADCWLDMTSGCSVVGLGSEDDVGVKRMNRWPFFARLTLLQIIITMRLCVITFHKAKLCRYTVTLSLRCELFFFLLYRLNNVVVWEDLSPAPTWKKSKKTCLLFYLKWQW